MLSRATTYSHRANGGEVECVEALHRRETGGADAALDHAPFAIDEFEFDETQQKADMVETFTRRLGGDFLVFPQDCWQFELSQVMRKLHPWRRGSLGGGRSRHAASLETSVR